MKHRVKDKCLVTRYANMFKHGVMALNKVTQLVYLFLTGAYKRHSFFV